MLATFLAGLLFTRVPNTHLDEFRDALAHGEILPMVDVPQTRVADSKTASITITRKQPLAALAGEQEPLVYKALQSGPAATTRIPCRYRGCAG